MVAWHGNPKDSYHKKTKIWDDNDLYNIAFQNSITPQHLIFVFTLLEACNLYKDTLLEKKKESNITSHESTVLSLLNERGSSFMIIHAISHMLETILEEKISKKYGIGFKDNLSRPECIDTWMTLIEKLSHQLLQIKSGLRNRLSVDAEIRASTDLVVRSFGTSFVAIKGMMKGEHPYQDFVNKIENKP